MAHSRVICSALFVALTAGPFLRPSLALTIGGRVWDDINRNGLQDDGEPGITQQAVFLSEYAEYEPFFQEPMATNVTDSSGRYEFIGVTNIARYLSIRFDYKYRVTSRNIGTDETLDNDFHQAYTFCGAPFALLPVTDTMTGNVNMDAGVYALVPGMNVSVSANGKSGNGPLYVTNGATVELVYSVTNSGETALSYIFFFDEIDPEGRLLIDCPSSLRRLYSLQFTNRLTVCTSMTNSEFLVAFPVENCTCAFHGSDPPYWEHHTVIIVVTNSPDFDDGDGIPGWWEIQCGLDPLTPCASGTDSDDDGMTDVEEFIADTNPTNSASQLPAIAWSNHGIVMRETSTNRIYSLWWSTNLLDEPQVWMLQPPETKGTGGHLIFMITNASPVNAYRTGVRLP